MKDNPFFKALIQSDAHEVASHGISSFPNSPINNQRVGFGSGSGTGSQKHIEFP